METYPNQISIEEKKTIYDIKYTYHSDLECQNYDAILTGIEEQNGRISLEPDHCGRIFEFYKSDPDRVITLAQMMVAFAQMVKNKSKNTIDITEQP